MTVWLFTPCQTRAGLCTFRRWTTKIPEHNARLIHACTDTNKLHVHVLGLGSIGCFAAHSLAEAQGRPRVTLLLHRQALLDKYVRNGCRISLQTNNGEIVHRSGYDFEILSRDGWFELSSKQAESGSYMHLDSFREETQPISNLILSVKASKTVAALRPLRQRLGHRSNILFLQNGTGMIEAVNENLFTDPYSRPNYITGVISHGVVTNAPFNIVHTGASALSLGPVPRQDDTSIHSDKLEGDSGVRNVISEKLINVLCSVPRLNAKSYGFTDVLQIQLEKLALNAFSNPICALNDSSTAYLQTIPDVRRMLTAEISAVILKLPELQGAPGFRERFAADRLDMTVARIAEQNAKTVCSMVWDLRAQRRTEIQFINGYWCRRGREVGVSTPMNDLLVEQVETRTAGW